MRVSDIEVGGHYIVYRKGERAFANQRVLAGLEHDGSTVVRVVARGPYLEKAAGPCGEVAVIAAPGVDPTYRVQMLVDGEWVERTAKHGRFILGWASWLEMWQANKDVSDEKRFEREAYDAKVARYEVEINALCPLSFGMHYDYDAGGRIAKAKVTAHVEDFVALLGATVADRKRLARLVQEYRVLEPPSCAR